MSNSNNKYKDAIPYDTIRNIRQSLHQLGIEVYENNWKNVSSECFSVRLEVDGFLGVGNNGKGTARSFALASAYGEIMERLQNKKLLNKSYGLKYIHQSFPDEKIDDIVKFSEENPIIIKHLAHDYENDKFLELFRNYPKLSYFSEFYDVFEEKKQLLPSILINMACGTNGMCAGNSVYEALCHGICEIMERYVSKEILYHQLTLPDIPIEDIKDQKTIDIIDLLNNAGLNVIIKDCTLGGRYPVIAVLLLNKSGTRYQFRLGCESIFSIALERCLTEIFQGRDIHSFISNSMLSIEYHFTNDEKWIKDNLMKISKNGTGQFPMSIFYNKKSDNNYQKAFLPKMENNKQGYEHLLGLLKQSGFKLYVRNLSFLGFPTYKVYIPGMSEIFLTDVNKIERKIKTNRAANCLLNISTCNMNELELLLEELVDYCSQNPTCFRLENTPYFKPINLHLKKENNFGKIDVRLIVSLLSYILAKDKIAANYFAWFMKSLPNHNYSNLNYYRCIMAFLQLKAISPDDKEILEKLELFPELIVSEVFEDFKERSIKLFSKMPFPSCPDCKGCRISKFCLWKEWEKINTIINRKLDVFNDFTVI
jgi:ribosomal protein S12 methylthiotransferase accessory factor